MQVTRRGLPEAESLQHALEDDHVTRDPEHALLLVAVLLSRLVQELDEDRVVQQLGVNHEPLHLVANIDRHVSLWNHRFAGGGPAAAELHPKRLASAWAGRRRVGGAQEAVLRRVGDAGEPSDQLLHDDGDDVYGLCEEPKREVFLEREEEMMEWWWV